MISLFAIKASMPLASSRYWQSTTGPYKSPTGSKGTHKFVALNFRASNRKRFKTACLQSF